MKKIILILAIAFTGCLGLAAQEPMNDGGFGGGRPPMMMGNSFEKEKTQIVKFPEIPGLTDKQRTKVGNVAVKEYDNVAKLENQKRKIFASYMSRGENRGEQSQMTQGNRPANVDKSVREERRITPPPAMANGENAQRPNVNRGQMNGAPHEKPQMPKLSEKDRKKVSEIDQKIAKEHAAADKKYHKMMSTEQYQAFAEKRGELKFNQFQHSDLNRGGHSEGSDRDRDGAGTPPERPANDNGDF